MKDRIIFIIAITLEALLAVAALVGAAGFWPRP